MSLNLLNFISHFLSKMLCYLLVKF